MLKSNLKALDLSVGSQAHDSSNIRYSLLLGGGGRGECQLSLIESEYLDCHEKPVSSFLVT